MFTPAAASRTAAFAFMALFMTTAAAHAAAPHNKPVAVAEAVSGIVSVTHKHEKQPQPLLNGDSLYEDDTVTTADAARVHIVFEDKTDMTVAGHGKLVIDNFVYNPKKPEENKADISVFGAAFSYVGGLIEKHKGEPNVNVHLDFGSIGVRGTRFARTMHNGKCWIYLEQGKITVSNKGGKVTLKPGQGTVMGSRQQAPHLRNWTAAEIALIKADAAGRKDSFNK